MGSSTPTHSATRIMMLGDAALTVEFGRTIDPAVNEQVIAFAELVRAQRWPGVLDIVPTYRSLTIHIDPLRSDLSALSDLVRSLSVSGTAGRISGREHRIPVLYGGEWGPDLEDVANFAGLSVTEAIRLHHSMPYRVYMLGFSPGFPYLGLVPAPIAMPRLETPRMTVPAGSIGIAGNQTGIYPNSTPGGWRLIGRTPVALYRPQSSSPFLLNPGDTVRFEPIEPEQFARMSRIEYADAS